MKHKHYDMIVAKAANVNLTTLVKFGNDWMISAPHVVGEIITFDSRYEYFLCLPQHKDACLHWLNGGNSQYQDDDGDWIKFTRDEPWDDISLWMHDEDAIRIKPKKEKRWVAALPNGRVGGWHDEAADQLKEQYSEKAGWQIIEIEVEV